MNSALVVEKKHPFPILIVDKLGIVGEKLAQRLSAEALVVLVSEKPVFQENVIHVPYLHKFPLIPDNSYSHIFIIDDNVSSTREALSSFLKKARNDNIALLYVASVFELGKEFIESIFDQYKNARVALYGDVFFVPDASFNNPLNKMIHYAVQTGNIVLHGSGLAEVYPVTLGDLITGLLEAAFGTDKTHKVYYLFPEHEVTEFSFAKNLLRVDPNLKLDFIKEEKKRSSPFVFKEGKFIFTNFSLDKKISEEKIFASEDHKSAREKKVSFKEKKRNVYLLSVIVSVFSLIVLPVVVVFVLSVLGLYGLNLSENSFKKGEFVPALSNTYLAEKSFSIAKKAESLLMFEASIVGMAKSVEQVSLNIDRGLNAASGLRSFALASSTFSSFFNGRNDSRETVRAGQSNLKDFLVFLQREQLENGDISKLLKQNKDLFSTVTSVAEVLPQLMALDGSKKYLILFQNNMELRPGGGFIGSYGVLSLNNGKLSDFKIHDVYDADGQLKGHVEPNYIIRRYMAIQHLYMRDSNFDVDFSKSASMVASMYSLETGEKVDGVIAVDLTMFKKILEATGPIYVSDYNETVNSENFFYLTESHAEKNFFPGSTQKKDFLRSLYEAVRLHLEQGKRTSFLIFAKAIQDSLLEKHLLFAFNDSSIQSVFTVNNWSSSLWDPRLETDGNINDFLGINEANIGTNKANYFISRSLSQKVAIADNGQVTEQVTISIRNDGDAWPGGDYLNYLRLVLPKDSQLLEINIDGKKQNITPAVVDYLKFEAKDFKKPNGLEVDKSVESGKDIYGFLTNIPAKKMQIIKVNYQLGKKLSIQKNNSDYSLKVFKQPGVDNYPYSFSIQIPTSFNLISSQNNFKKLGNSGNYSADLREDTSFTLQIAKQ